MRTQLGDGVYLAPEELFGLLAEDVQDEIFLQRTKSATELMQQRAATHIDQAVKNVNPSQRFVPDQFPKD